MNRIVKALYQFSTSCNTIAQAKIFPTFATLLHKTTQMIPQTFDAWRNCIINDCKINLTKDFAQQRLAVYQNVAHPETKKFVSLYGEQHLQNIVMWLQQI